MIYFFKGLNNFISVKFPPFMVKKETIFLQPTMFIFVIYNKYIY